MSISHRISLAWAPNFRPFENTDTLVLTGKSWFIDQRILLRPDPLTSNKIDWVFFGTCSESKSHLSTPGETHVEWKHLVDSRSLGSNPSVDQGLIIHPHPSHREDTTLSLERGRMVNPETGFPTQHEEVWKDEVLESGVPVVFSQAQHSMALVGRVGKYALGCGLSDSEGGMLWTWRAQNTSEVDASEWAVTLEHGNQDRKGFSLLTEDMLSEGTIWSEGTSWSVVQSWAI